METWENEKIPGDGGQGSRELAVYYRLSAKGGRRETQAYSFYGFMLARYEINGIY